ncbi:hypothetical protein [Lacihabitans sp. LS3-19]|uniref:hypothetical protein n=2 Tax=Lacihabitans sp. LS3-19 TaxID=2487335 RepID=UPI0020CF32CD|nr:hypothetical protein [Lacihabitans sp. LS3-19]
MSQSEEVIFSKIIDFIKGIGIPVVFSEITDEMFLPGLRVENGVLKIDIDKLSYIGDILHEAGHIAVMSKEERECLSGKLDNQENDAANEMAVMAWTYAVCLEIGIEPNVVFHADGYKGDSENIINNFDNGHYIGVPILHWYGMTNEKFDLNQKNAAIFPKMLRWVRP